MKIAVVDDEYMSREMLAQTIREKYPKIDNISLFSPFEIKR